MRVVLIFFGILAALMAALIFAKTRPGPSQQSLTLPAETAHPAALPQVGPVAKGARL